jgi:hypothetical protein
MRRSVGDFVNGLKEEIASIWTLLNDTAVFLSRIKKAEDYEKDFKEWRAQLQRFQGDVNVRRDVREKIIALRKFLRAQGYDLVLGSRDLQLFGFKSDDATLQGYRRLVIAISKDQKDIFYLSGEDNHVSLIEFLAARLGTGSLYAMADVHSLWYRWRDNVLQICGADTETREDYENLKKFAENNKNLILKKLKKL